MGDIDHAAWMSRPYDIEPFEPFDVQRLINLRFMAEIDQIQLAPISDSKFAIEARDRAFQDDMRRG
jgi:hypothetical protein